MKRLIRIAALVITACMLAACNLPYAVQPTPAGSSPVASVTPFAVATPEAVTATQPAILVITLTPEPQSTETLTATLLPATATQPAATSMAPPSASPTAVVYPDTPDGVIEAFVESYPDDTADMLLFLSSSLQASLPAGGPGALLNLSGSVNGMIILSGAAAPNPPQAEYQVALQVGTEQVLRTFTLGQENGRWVITGIQ